MKKRIVLCADDYGQALTISQGIIQLIKQDRLTATSCMVNTSVWPQHAKWLIPYQHKIDVGLHFNLTEGHPLSSAYIRQYGEDFFVLPTLLGKALGRCLKQAAVEAECHAQIDHFYHAMGFLPAYIDGHQHIHQFPVIRHAILAVYNQRLREHQAYLRLINEAISLGDWFFNQKKIIIYATGTRGLKNQLQRQKIPHNQSLAGIYPFSLSPRYAQLFVSFLKQVTDKGLIFCHPGGLAPPETTDSLAKTRFDEYQYLSSPQFLKDCEAQAVVLQRFHQIATWTGS